MLQQAKLAFSNLKQRGLRSLLTMLGIFIGIAAVVALISLGNSLQQAITGQFSTIAADRLLIQNQGTGFGPPGSTAVEKLHQHDLDIIKNIPGVSLAVPRLLRVGKVEFARNTHFIFMSSLPKEQKGIDFLYETFHLEAAQGKLLKQGDKHTVILGSEVAKHIGKDKPIQAGSRITIQDKEFEVLAILKSTGSFQFNNAIFIQEEDIKEIFSIGDDIDFIVVQAKELSRAQEVASSISNALRRDRHEKLGEEDFSVETPNQALGTVNTILSIINIIVAGIAAISLLVGGIGIANAMFASVLERTKQIGTMKAVGAKNQDIVILFLLESGMLGLIGGIVGALLGLLLAFLAASGANTYFGSSILQVHPSLPLLGASVLFAFLVGILSGTVPALQASKLKPVEALRQ